MTRDNLRTFTLQVLRSLGRGTLQVRNVLLGVANEARTAGISDSEELSGIEERDVLEILWELCIAGLLRPGMNKDNPGMPWYSVTSFGVSVLADVEGALPYHSAEYMRSLRTRVPTVDPIIVEYIDESLRSFNAGALKAATVMLGVAAEQGLLLLLEAFGDALADKTARDAFTKKMRDQSIKRKMDVFGAEVKRLRTQQHGSLPRDIVDDFDVWISAMSNMIRNYRNEHGHPGKVEVDRTLVLANLQMFIPYCAKVYALLTFLKDRAGTLGGSTGAAP
jgi:hypothetical protein